MKGSGSKTSLSIVFVTHPSGWGRGREGPQWQGVYVGLDWHSALDFSAPKISCFLQSFWNILATTSPRELPFKSPLTCEPNTWGVRAHLSLDVGGRAPPTSGHSYLFHVPPVILPSSFRAPTGQMVGLGPVVGVGKGRVGAVLTRVSVSRQLEWTGASPGPVGAPSCRAPVPSGVWGLGPGSRCSPRPAGVTRGRGPAGFQAESPGLWGAIHWSSHVL